jgi:flagellar basal-body rod protein FlgB
MQEKRHVESEFNIKIDEESPILANGNNVDVSKEMADMAKNSIMFKFASKKMNGYFQNLQNIIRGGK